MLSKVEQPNQIISLPDIDRDVTSGEAGQLVVELAKYKGVADISLTAVREKIGSSQSKQQLEVVDYLSFEVTNFTLNIDKRLVKKLLIEKGGLTEDEAERVEIEVSLDNNVDDQPIFKKGNLFWSTEITRRIAKNLPHYRIKEIFTRTQTLSDSTVKLFMNNVEVQVNQGNLMDFTKDLAHHLLHVAQRIRHKRGNPVVSALKRSLWHWPKHQIARLPFFHGASPAEKEARNPMNAEGFEVEYGDLVKLEEKE
ncbi:MAG: hypothetical protein UT32_C0006G0006 [Parcubacteria group bacterium GW2011_GWC2_39_14]|nr:MAG: hypothetical protein UT32_C0006G0006 [Parcubacteria group bacterium GW2011_GWC2_39_14]KKR54794.1 MAG: hypothetical protein UT91_C0009G0006 [Parcubacteria group bacterium GW2011_GWA2_40_23]